MTPSSAFDFAWQMLVIFLLSIIASRLKDIRDNRKKP